MADSTDVQSPAVIAPAPIAGAPFDAGTSLLRNRPFRLLFITRVTSTTATQMLAVIVGWHVYELTNSPFHLGMIGLVQMLPPLVLLLAAGPIVDRFNRRTILRCCYALALCASCGLALVAALPRPSVAALYALVVAHATMRVFELPVMQSLVPAMVPRAALSRGIAAHVFARQLSVLIGPSLGGVLYAFGAAFDYGVCASLFTAALIASFRLPASPGPQNNNKMTWDTILAGFRFISRCQPLLGAISLDVMSALFGGATTLLPIYARDILGVGAWGAGLLRSAPGLGALVAVAILARMPVRRSGGLFTYAGFAMVGAATIAFGLSHSLALSIVALMLMGGAEMVSVVVRQMLIMVATPEGMRGRVGAVDALFYGTSSQLGAFAAGTMAAAVGAVAAVVISGGALLATVMIWPWLIPGLRRVDRPEDVRPPPP
jgi:MFS family permease